MVYQAKTLIIAYYFEINMSRSQDSIIIRVGAVIFDTDGRLLLVRHVPEKRSFWEGKWIMPDGMLRYGESLEKCAIREIKEETNLDISIIKYISTIDNLFKESSYNGLYIIYIDFLSEVTGGELKCGSDVGEVVWVSKDEILRKEYDLHPDTLKILSNIGWI
jgi:ADP-ribose pyrophosphatase YjhB (NUDIX family)